MTEWNEVHPEVEVQPAEYQRLLGYPPGHVLDGRAQELADWAREWYAEHGRPWIYAREVGQRRNGRRVGEDRRGAISQRRLRRRFERASADGAILAAVSAGPEIEQEAQKLWREEKPDEYYLSGSVRLRGSGASDHDDRRAPVRMGGEQEWRCCRITARAIRSGTSRSSRAFSGCSRE